APRDAAPAPDAAGLPELVVPGPQFVREPLPIAGLGGRPDAGAVHGTERGVEARVPATPPLDFLPRQVRDLFGGLAEARRARHRAVGAGEAASGDDLPPGMLG